MEGILRKIVRGESLHAADRAKIHLPSKVDITTAAHRKLRFLERQHQSCAPKSVDSVVKRCYTEYVPGQTARPADWISRQPKTGKFIPVKSTSPRRQRQPVVDCFVPVIRSESDICAFVVAYHHVRAAEGRSSSTVEIRCDLAQFDRHAKTSPTNSKCGLMFNRRPVLLAGKTEQAMSAKEFADSLVKAIPVICSSLVTGP